MLILGGGYLFFALQTAENDIAHVKESLTALDQHAERLEITLQSLQKDGYVEKPSLVSMSEKVLPAVVFIMEDGVAGGVRYNEGEQVLSPTSGASVRGTGFFISSNGYIATAAHVLQGLSLDTIIVKDAQNVVHHAKIVSESAQTDISIVKIEGKNFTPVTFGHFSNVEVGEEIGFIGFNPGFNRPLLHAGNVSAIGVDENSAKVFTINSFVNRGNSGSPVFSRATGRVIGIVSARQHETINREPINLDSIHTGVVLSGGIDPVKFSAQIYNDMLQLAKETTQVGIGIIYSTDEIKLEKLGR